MSRITINNIYFDPTTQSRAVRNAGLDSPDSSGSNYAIVQFTAPITPAQESELNSLGLEILEYHPENAYVCRFPPASLAAVQALPYVEFAGVYPQEVKVALPLRSSSAVATANLLELGPIETSMAQQPVDIDVVLHNGADAEAVRTRIAQASRLDPDDLQVSSNKIRLTVRPQALEDLAAIDEVKTIQKVPENKLFNNVALGIIGADRTHNDSNLKGEGQVIAICDTGFDKGDTTNVHPAFVGRVLKLYGSSGRNGKKNDPNGHGTHVAGSVLGDGYSATMGGSIRGTAPAAKLVFQSVLDWRGGLGGLPANLNDLFIEPYQNDNARVHTNSWGADVFGAYTTNSQEVDQFVFNHRDCVICFAAGNAGSDSDANGTIDAGSVGSPATAKNCITVGASESYRPDKATSYGDGKPRYGNPWHIDFPVPPIEDDLWADNVNGMAAFSSRGPVQGNRIKPDIVAPGTAILSTHSRDARVGAFWGESTDPLFCFMGGTSMATPLVAGCVAVVREFFIRDRAHPNPSAALVKAMLINGAEEITGQYSPSEAGIIPSFSQGFGRVNLAATVGPFDPNVTIEFRDENRALRTGEEESITINLDSKVTLLKVTLVWTDPPGAALQNDLDLIVRATGQERHGNVPSTSSEFDRTNNVEQVLWSGIPTGNVEIVVRAYRALPAQTYALVIRTV